MQVGPDTSRSHLHCRCTHLSTFAGGFLVMPNTLNLAEDIAKFAQILENPVGLIVVCVALGIYIGLVLWARRKDKQCLIKVWGVVSYS